MTHGVQLIQVLLKTVNPSLLSPLLMEECFTGCLSGPETIKAPSRSLNAASMPPPEHSGLWMPKHSRSPCFNGHLGAKMTAKPLWMVAEWICAINFYESTAIPTEYRKQVLIIARTSSVDISNLLASSEEPPYLLGSVSAEASIKLKLCKVSPRKKNSFSWGKKNQANVRQAQQHTAQAEYRHGSAAPVCVVQIPEVSPALLTSCSDE